MEKIKFKKVKSVRIKLFMTICLSVIIVMGLLVLLNNFVIENFYLYVKTNKLKDTYKIINNYYNSSYSDDIELEKIAINNNFSIIIKNNEGINVYSSEKDFLYTLEDINAINTKKYINRQKIIYKDDKVIIKKSIDVKTNLRYIFMVAMLDNDNILYIRMPIAAIEESARISNNFLYIISIITIIIAGIIASFISKQFTEPILQLNDIAKRMSKLDFSKKYRIKDADDEIDTLGKSINTMSDKLEITINQLRNTNIELEKDIDEKSKIDEMRKQFISDVSHELKTPISLIQGYAEGLIENVNTDDENRKFYAEVILDETNKMDKLVKQLLELMKLEYGKREFRNVKFDIVELINEVIKKSQVVLEEKDISIEFKEKDPIYVYADDFYIEQVLSNYFTNAIKHCEKIENDKKIKISIKEKKDIKKIRISIFNTGEKISEEDLNRIWNRFYKVDSSRNREKGGSGIGLSLVKAIMNNYGNAYGVINKECGVEFYFELDKIEN